MDQWTPRVTARAELATLLRSTHSDRAIAAGLKVDDLDALIKHGDAAREADRRQKEQLGEIDAERAGRKVDNEALFDKEDELRDRLPAVIGDLRKSGNDKLALWVEALSFARFRFREMAPKDGAPRTDDAEIQKVARIEREDIPTRLSGLASFCAAIRKPGREPIVAALAERGLSAEWIAALGSDAEAASRAGRNVKRAADATEEEAREAAAQRAKWLQVRRMIRKAVRGVPALVSKLAEC